MSGKDELAAAGNHISTVEPGAQTGQVGPHTTPGWGTRSGSIALSVSESMRDSTRSWGLLLSAAVLVNVLVLGCAFVGGSVFNERYLTSVHLQIFLMVLLAATVVWMIFFTAYTCREEEEGVLYKDFHAGPVWLRGGLVLFGICSLIMDVFKIAVYVGYAHCESPVKIVFPVVQAMFVLVQTYFLWIHAKDCVQVQRNITRCGLMLTLATNLMVWIMAVTEESLHQTVYPKDNESHTVSKLSFKASAQDEDSCECNHMACTTFEQAYFYLYPFNIEYSLFASAMAYVMWKNVGRLVDDHGSHEHSFHMRDVLLGPASGLVVFVAGLATFVVYEVEVTSEDPGKRDTGLTMYYVTNIIIVALMTAAAGAGCTVFYLEQREHALGKNPTRSLDVGLLMGASVGQLIISYFSIVAVLAIGVGGHVNGLNLTWSLLTVLELSVQNVFIIEGLRREPHQDTRRASIFSNLLVMQAHDERRRSSNVLTPRGSIALSVHKALPWKRKLLKEISAFLLLSNILLWIIPAFGARPEFDNPIGTDFYKFNMWSAVVNVGLPFGIFYRMHSVASLFEVYLTS